MADLACRGGNLIFRGCSTHRNDVSSLVRQVAVQCSARANPDWNALEACGPLRHSPRILHVRQQGRPSRSGDIDQHGFEPGDRSAPHCPSGNMRYGGKASNGIRSGSNRIDLIRVNPRNPLRLSALKILLLKFLLGVNRCRFDLAQRILARISEGDYADSADAHGPCSDPGESQWSTVLLYFSMRLLRTGSQTALRGPMVFYGRSPCAHRHAPRTTPIVIERLDMIRSLSVRLAHKRNPKIRDNQSQGNHLHCCRDSRKT
jgi:hypothetical protein